MLRTLADSFVSEQGRGHRLPDDVVAEGGVSDLKVDNLLPLFCVLLGDVK